MRNKISKYLPSIFIKYKGKNIKVEKPGTHHFNQGFKVKITSSNPIDIMHLLM